MTDSKRYTQTRLSLSCMGKIWCILAFASLLGSCSLNGGPHDASIDRQSLVSRHNPQLRAIEPSSPFTVGNGQFAFTADVTGFQSFSDLYFKEGTPLETKARWAWHARNNDNLYVLTDADETYSAYGAEVAFPTNMDSPAGKWLRQNPHDLPLARIALKYQGNELLPAEVEGIRQSLDLWHGVLNSQFKLASTPVSVVTVADQRKDAVGFQLSSDLLSQESLSIGLSFPRGYDLSVKNTPPLLWNQDTQHSTEFVSVSAHSALIKRRVDNQEHWVNIAWSGNAKLEQSGPHSVELKISANDSTDPFSLTVAFSQSHQTTAQALNFKSVISSARAQWPKFWRSGAAIDFSGSTNKQAKELERRVILSQYLMAVQERADIPPQETGLTSSSWYGKFHTEMMWWHGAHWALWDRSTYTEKILQWYNDHLDIARDTALTRGLNGARWSKMVGPEGRESPGGNPLIIWNQPHPIALAELIYERNPTPRTLEKYAQLVEETAEAMSSMLVWQPETKRYSLLPPIWIAQEHYPVNEVVNPSFELSYWYVGLKAAQRWRQRLGLPPKPVWQQQIDQLASLPQKDGRYVAIESIPDTFDNLSSRNDHPTMIAMWGLLSDDRVDIAVMENTLDAVLAEWDFEERIWGWDYPMIAMTASKLDKPQVAVDSLLMDAHNNYYEINGHCRQKKVGLPAYLPANGALLAAVAYMAAENPDSPTLGFPNDGTWQVRAEGFIGH